MRTPHWSPVVLGVIGFANFRYLTQGRDVKMKKILILFISLFTVNSMASTEISTEEVISFCKYAMTGRISTEHAEIYKHGLCFGVLSTAVSGHLSENECLDNGLNFKKMLDDVSNEYQKIRNRGENWHSGPYKFIVHVMQTSLPKRDNGCPNTDLWLSDKRRYRLGIK